MADPLTLLLSTLEDLLPKELKKFGLYLTEGTVEGFPRIPRGRLPPESDATHFARQMTEMYGGEGSLKITLHILREINHNELAERLEIKLQSLQINEHSLLSDELHFSDKCTSLQRILQSDMKIKVQKLVEGGNMACKDHSISLNDVYVELYITEGGTGDINDQHEVRQLEVTHQAKRHRDTPIQCADIFKCLPGQTKEITTVLTKGIAGIGKTFSVHKFILDWAEQKTNNDIAVVVSLPFRDLNQKKTHHSLKDLLCIYSPQLQNVDNLQGIASRMLIIMDGLDECRHPLDFQNAPWWSDVSMPTSIDVLLTNLIRGNLLSSALIWITSRPAAASQIPSEYVDRVTEVQGFGDSQKEEYFRKRIRDEGIASRIVAYIKTIRTIFIMCHIPLFCWIAATVFESTFDDAKPDEVPKTLTEMYTHFLTVQMGVKNKKYKGGNYKHQKVISSSDKKMILKLGKLAYNQLGKSNLIFYEGDLQECDIDIRKTEDYSSLCTEVFKVEDGLHSERIFSFVHLTIQEFLAAVYVHVSCVQNNMDVIVLHSPVKGKEQVKLSDVHQKAVEKALQSPNGHYDLFLRFLLGLSRDSKQTFLQSPTVEQPGLLGRSINALLKLNFPQEANTISTQCVDQTVNVIMEKITSCTAPERTINLIHCLSELKDNSLVTGTMKELVTGKLSRTLLEAECSALAYVALMSSEVLEVFDLKTFKTSAAGQQRLLCMLKAFKHAR
ncbi:NLR family CARD domain-containing protein 3-like [Engraulis encrasicolus]|uniref:NLR family CARD domain-containing protein 3-like n=1 Tax=Engraulis encrasicolus TaxID=184585 RepID=UPI002FD4AD56